MEADSLPQVCYGDGDHLISRSLCFCGLSSFLNGCWIQFLLEVEEVVEGPSIETSAEENLQSGSNRLCFLFITVAVQKAYCWAMWGIYHACNMSVRNRPFCLECAWWDAIKCLNIDKITPKKLKLTGYSTPFIKCIPLDYSDHMEKYWLFKGGFANCNQLVLCLFMSLNSSVVPVTTLEMKNILHYLRCLEQHFRVNKNNNVTNTIYHVGFFEFVTMNSCRLCQKYFRIRITYKPTRIANLSW